MRFLVFDLIGIMIIGVFISFMVCTGFSKLPQKIVTASNIYLDSYISKHTKS